MKILAISDMEVSFLYSPAIIDKFKHVGLVVSCGDLPYYYMEYIISMLDRPLYYVRGNHASKVELTSGGERLEPWGGINLHKQTKRDDSGVILAGIEGSIRYNTGPQQFSQGEMWMMAFQLVPKLLLNRSIYGRALDILVTHSPPWKIHDQEDRPHQGIKAFRWLAKVFKPMYHLHGHIHLYRQDAVCETRFETTRIINACGYREIDFTLYD
jgi:Icc-related predicted phosphoesterase